MEWLKKTQNPFSIRQWIAQDDNDGGWLFLSSVPEMCEALKPQSLMSLKPSADRRLWFVIDELPALKKLPDFHAMLAEARKYGGCVIIGTQDMSLLDDVYGYNLVKSIANLCSTKVVFRVASADIAERVSKWLGSQEVSEAIENISYGAHQHASGARYGEERAIGKPRGGAATKVHIATDAYGNPIDFAITGGEVHDVKVAGKIIEKIGTAKYFVADKGDDSEELGRKAGMTPVIHAGHEPER